MINDFKCTAKCQKCSYIQICKHEPGIIHRENLRKINRAINPPIISDGVTNVYNHFLCTECENYRQNKNHCKYEMGECILNSKPFNKYKEKKHAL